MGLSPKKQWHLCSLFITFIQLLKFLALIIIDKMRDAFEIYSAWLCHVVAGFWPWKILLRMRYTMINNAKTLSENSVTLPLNAASTSFFLSCSFLFFSFKLRPLKREFILSPFTYRRL